jgi:adenylate cyclase
MHRSKIIRIPFFILVILHSSFVISSAQQNLDSLYLVWQDQTQGDSFRAKAYKDYIWKGFLFSDPDSAFILADELIAFGMKMNYPKGQAIGLNIKGVSKHLKGDYPKALDYYSQSLKINKQLDDQKGIASSLINIGSIYSNQGDNPKALDYYSQSLKIFKQLDDQKGIANSINNIGNIYFDQGDYSKALDYFSQSLKIFKQLGDQKGIAMSLGNIGLIYSNQGDYSKALDYYSQSLKINEQLGDQKGIASSLNNIGSIYSKQGDYPQALDHYSQSLKIKEQLGDQRGIAYSLNNFGSIYSKQGDYPKALDYYSQSLKIFKQLGDQRGIALSLNNIGGIYSKQGDYPKALDKCQKGYELALSIGVLDQQKNACKCLYDTYKAMGKGNEALVYLEKMNVISDSLDAEETTKKLQQMEFTKQVFADSIKQEEEKRLVQEAHQEEVAKKNKTRNIAIGSGLLAILLAGGFYSRWRYVKKAKDTISKEKDRSENLLLNILPAEIAAELKANGKAEARDFDQISILFTDFKEFTQLSEQLSAQELVGEINHCFEGFDGICTRYGVEKIKTIGDSYMAAGGLPVPKAESTKNTVLAALEMADFIIKRKQEREAVGKVPFEMRAGIHTGNVVAGIVGVKKFQYDIWGDTVNTASRMESHGEIGKVNISQSTFELIKDDSQFTFEHRGKVEAKGKGEIEMYFVNLSSTGA